MSENNSPLTPTGERTEFEDYMMEQFLENKFYFSYSSLQKLMNDPRDFYKKYILKEWDDEDTKVLKQGKLFHCFVLEPENFDDKFIIMSGKMPSPGPKSVVDMVFERQIKHKITENEDLIGTFFLENFEPQILEALIEVDLYQNLTDAKRKDAQGRMLTGDEKRLEKILTVECKKYFSLLQEGEKKTIVDMDMVTVAKQKANVMLQNKQVMDWLNPDTSKIDSRTEFEHKTDINGFIFGLKGIIDLIHIDSVNEKITIVDFKTTSKTIKDWGEGFDESKYLYWLQPIVYKELILSLVPEKSKHVWKLEVYYPVIDKNNLVYIFPDKGESLRKWEVQAKEVLEKAKWHMETQSFDLSYEYAKGLVSL